MSGKKALFIALILIAVGLYLIKSSPGLPSSTSSKKSLEEAKAKAEEFISKKMVQPGTKFEIKEIVKENNLYKITVEVKGKNFVSYMSSDLALFFPSGISTDVKDTQQAESQEIPKSENPEVQLFIMSFCPFGNQAEDIMKPVADLIGKSVEIEPHYIFYDEQQGYKGADYCLDDVSQYCSMHGINEANQDLRELCVYKNQKEKYWDFVIQVNKDCDVENVETCWEKAAETTGVDVTKVTDCFNTNSLVYAKQEKEITDELGVGGSPTLLINGVKYTGQRSPENYKKAICGAFENPPEECSQTLESTSPASSGGCG